jgi:hypothetical protein
MLFGEDTVAKVIRDERTGPGKRVGGIREVRRCACRRAVFLETAECFENRAHPRSPARSAASARVGTGLEDGGTGE